MFGLFAKKDVIEADIRQWIFEVFDWSLQHFDATVFARDSQLIEPSNRHFPGQVNSVHGMAELVFSQVRDYAGMQHWPFELVQAGNSCSSADTSTIRVEGPARGISSTVLINNQSNASIAVEYDPALVNNPQALIAGFAHTLAHYLASSAGKAPPGDEHNWPHVTELVAVFMGFGLMFANSAYTASVSSCGSCGGATAKRSGFLTENDLTYALALFCVLKDVPGNKVLPHLKSTLRGHYKHCVRDVQAEAGLGSLQKVISHEAQAMLGQPA